MGRPYLMPAIAVAVPGGTRITGGMFSGAISTDGTIGGTVSFADVDVTVQAGSHSTFPKKRRSMSWA